MKSCLKQVFAVLPLVVVLSACNESFELHTNTGTHIRTTVGSSSAKTISARDKEFKSIIQEVKCRKSDLVTRKFSAGWMSESLQVCPGLTRWAATPSQSADSVVASYTVDFTGNEKVFQRLQIDHSLAKDFSVERRREGASYCQVVGSFDSAKVLEFASNRVKLVQPADSLRCVISSH